MSREYRMLKNKERKEEILNLVNSSKKITVEELAKRTYASPSTIRRELKILEGQGLLRRRHGGAESVLYLRPPQIIRHLNNQNEKKIIAKKASALIKPESCIFIDASTTVQYIIPYLAGIQRITVYTNGADTAIKLAEAGVKVICTGGNLLSESMAYVGSVAADTVRKVYFDAVFFSSAAFDESVISDWSEEETVLRRAVIEQSAKRYFLADGSKQGKRYTHIVCRLSEVDEIISE